MQLVDRALARLDGTLNGDSFDWQKWLKPSDTSRIISAESLAVDVKKQILLGHEAEEGFGLPWARTEGKVLIKPGKLAIWCGWQHSGKSQMLKQVMLYAITQGERVLIASMEEEVKEIWQDLCYMYAGNDKPTPRMIDEFLTVVRGKLWFYDQQGSVETNRMIALIRYAAHEFKITQCVIDSLMMLAVSRDDYEAQAKFVGELKTCAKDTRVTNHLVAHMRKRDGKTGEDVPGTVHDISGGHEIASKADYVFNVWRDKAKKKEGTPPCVLGVEKQRGRKNWIGRIGLEFHDSSRQFVENARFPFRYDNDQPPDIAA